MKDCFYSYDLFDTCFIRKCGKQDFVFELLAKEIVSPKDESIIYDFVLARKRAEENARNSTCREDVNIDEIYKYFDVSFFTDISVRQIIDTELRIHISQLVPVRQIFDTISNYHANNKNVIFISDMYISGKILEPFLRSQGLFCDGDKLFVSCDIGLTKQSGHLYDYVKDKLGLSFSNWTHIGDNLYSDYKVPKERGIHAKRIVHNFSYYEQMMAECDMSVSDFDVFKLAACARAVRLTLPEGTSERFAADFIATNYVPFVYMILSDASKRGIKNLYFIARDGYILLRIAEVFQPLFSDIKLCYLKASRKSLYLPGLKDLTLESIISAFPVSSSNVQDLLNMLQMSDFLIETADYAGKNPEHIVSSLLQNKEFVKLLTKRYIEQNQLCVKYFNEMGLTQPCSALVDVFGSRKCERSINNILVKSGFKKVYGYYYGVMWERILDASHYSSLQYKERIRLGGHDSYYFSKQNLFEQYFSLTDQNRTIGYQMTGGRVLPIYEVDDNEANYRRRVMDVNLRACVLFAQYYSDLRIVNNKKCCEVSQTVFNNFFLIPRKDFLYALEGFCETDDGVKRMLLYRQSLFGVFRRRLSLEEWFHGNLIYNSGFLYRVVLLFLKILHYVKIKRYIVPF